MRKLFSFAGAAVLALTTFASPANAQSPTAGGSCGPAAGSYGMTDVNSGDVNASGDTVPGLFYQINYANVPAPTTIGVIARYNGELESQIQVAQFTAQNSGGTATGAITANISPDAQGFNNSSSGNRGNPGGGGFSPGENRARKGNKDGPRDNNVPGAIGPTGGASPAAQGGVTPGEYIFYIYTGSRGDVYNVKDGTVARDAFIADEKGFLGMFSCGVSTEQGSGAG
jgi:hypothetical protein